MSENTAESIEDVNNNLANENVISPAVQDQETQPQSNELLDIVFTLESEKQALVEESRKRIFTLRKELEQSQTENEQLKRRVNQLEQSLKQSVMLGGVDAPKSRQEQDELLLKAKTLLFEKTKVCKQQEQQVEVLKNQVEAMKDVVQVTKDMLNLKSAECDHMQVRLEKSQQWIKAEKDKCAITEKKLLISKGVYDKLRAEYDIQSKIFKDLKEVYEQKIKMLGIALEEAKKK
ncbi:PREDICTED: calcium-binding and coiled-coil domain-containing protein 2 [Bactrocera latifrons]|uniref:calcium-binding and coiled-coil domain-containing protein 2 n=1 Tax=Bactrocera latifrons TaxID=174628 RepID=UPI0008DD9CBB|nr:PREDICTED: calcium-binding and coiled-coil domain-containing protein 2 [Bactrocera latifrons]